MLREGQTLLHYRLVDKVGEGGMGVVWRAIDTTLDREVAIKTLPPAFAGDAERLARFEREAKLLASLNHPHIAAVYGLHEAEGQRLIAMELVRGEDLAQRLRRGPLPVEATLSVARQVAEALEAAHESGVIHRDLKPANVKLDPEGRVKVLDFGLAKAFEAQAPASGPTSLSMSPTVTSAGTVAGVVMGTASYMSPEQARGKPVDKRTDVWAFGCLLYEMLTGKRLFDGETVSDVLASVLKTDPDWEALPAQTPKPLLRLLRRCLTRDPRRRVRDIGDARIELEDIASGAAVDAAEPAPLPRWRVPALVAFGLLIGVVLTLGFTEGFKPKPPAAPTHLSYVPPPGRLVSLPMSTPDGRSLIYWGREVDRVDRSDVWKIYRRSLDTGEDVALEGTTGGRELLTISPDGRWVGFVVRVSPGSRRQHFKKVPADGSGRPTVVAEWPPGMLRQDPLWLDDGDLLAVRTRPWSLWRVPTDGRSAGEPLPIGIDFPVQSLRLVGRLPGDRHAIANVTVLGTAGLREDLYLIDVADGSTKLLIENAGRAAWSPSGRLVFSRRDQLLAVPFDLDTLETTGAPVTVAHDRWSRSPGLAAWFHLSAAGTLVTMPGGGGADERTLGFLSRDGSFEPWSELKLAFRSALVSPDGKQAAFTVDNITEGEPLWQIRVSDFDRPRLRTLAARPGEHCETSMWMRDSVRLVYRCRSDEGGALWLRRADGGDAPRKILEYGGDERPIEATSSTADGTELFLYQSGVGPTRLSLTDADADPVPLIPDDETAGPVDLSEDGRFITYSSTETGRQEVYLRSYRGGRLGPKVLVTTSGGRSPAWSEQPQGGPLELLYLNQKQMWSIAVDPGPPLTFSDPIVQYADNELRVETGSQLPDGRFFVILSGEQEDGASRIDVTLNWHP